MSTLARILYQKTIGFQPEISAGDEGDWEGLTPERSWNGRLTMEGNEADAKNGPGVPHGPTQEGLTNDQRLCMIEKDRWHPEGITTLLDSGADVKAKDNDGNTAFDLAGENKRIKGTVAYRILDEARE